MSSSLFDDQHTPYEAVENYRAPIVRAVKTLNPEAFLVPGKHSRNFQLGAEVLAARH